MKSRSVARVVCLSSLFSAAVAGLAGSASAQSLRPNIMFIFDTSGSMAQSTGTQTVGEGTNVCPAGTTSRIYNLKQALRSALQQVGTDEANFGLMSFPMAVGTNFDGTCTTGGGAPRVAPGHYTASPTQPGVTTHNRPVTQGTNGTTTASTFTGGCLMSTNRGNETSFGPWFVTGGGEVLRVGVTTAAGTATPTAANYDPADGNIGAVYKWIDNTELPVGTGAVTDPELHALGYTPLGRSFFYARSYFDGLVKPNDPKSTCRQNVVIMVTDGAETCDDSTPPDSSFNLADCTGGGNYDYYHPIAQACRLFRQSGIKAYLVTDTGLSSTELATADKIANAGGTTAAIRVSLADANAAKAAIVGIIASTVPPPEMCNGKDDNCNGIIDEGVANMCPYSKTDPNDADNKLGTAAKHCAVETANCLDDNCNGVVDEGFPPNACGMPGGCPVPPEVCDGIDNNCNGDVDEGFNVGVACDNGLSGSCRRVGLTECSADHTGVTCNLGDAPITAEICNGIDDDCNGQIDEGPLPGVGLECGVQGMGCSKGVTVCLNGKIVCNATSNPKPEVCNGLDDDCNGVIDDGTFPGVGDSCLCPGLTQAEVGQGMCRAGRLVCKGVQGIVCDGCVLPSPEICDGKDNDCDGVGDNSATCPSGFGCRDGACALQCRPGEFPCPPGYDCSADNYCIPNRCKNVTCAADQKCDLATGSCVDLCYKVSCLSGQTCSGGKCLDCSNSTQYACQPGQTCVGRQCVTDLCYGVTCDTATEYCANGACVPITCSPACGAGQECFAGQCRTSLCSTANCAAGTYCDPGTGACLPDMCVGKACAYCAKATGECTTDPCGNVQCPFCYTCQVDPSGTPSCQPQNQQCEALKVETGSAGGGCSCSVDDGHGLSGLAGLFSMAAFALVLRRRRR